MRTSTVTGGGGFRDRDPPVQRPPCRENPPGQRPPDRDPPGQRSPVDRQTPVNILPCPKHITVLPDLTLTLCLECLRRRKKSLTEMKIWLPCVANVLSYFLFFFRKMVEFPTAYSFIEKEMCGVILEVIACCNTIVFNIIRSTNHLLLVLHICQEQSSVNVENFNHQYVHWFPNCVFCKRQSFACKTFDWGPPLSHLCEMA